MNEIQITEQELKPFDYSLVDNSTAEFLKCKELNVKVIANTMINQIGKELKEAQDELAIKGYGCFGEWYTSLGFKKTTVYNYINKYNYIVSSTVEQAEVIEELPLNLVYEITKPSANQELNQKVFDGDITTFKEYKDMERKNKELEKQVEELEKQEPIVIEKEVEKIVRVVPDDYKELKANQANKVDKQDFNRLRKELEEKVDENHELKKQIKQLAKTDSKEQHKEKLKDNTLIFCNRVHNFLNDVGGLAWLTEYIEELEEYDKRSYYKALDLLEGWVMTVKSNINKGDF